MKVLGIESTCDETAAAIVKDGTEILSHVIASQIEAHRPYGGVVPEIASRQHLERISDVVRQAMVTDVDLVAVAQGPGLVGALMVGIETAKGLALGLDKPLIGINHVEAHLYAAIMTQPEAIEYPALGVVVSGGHTALVRIKSVGDYEMLSTTVDDAIGEAFDKVASLLGLPYPGGPHVEKLAKEGNPNAFSFHAGQVKGKPLHFSFSGLKTNVLYAIKGQGGHKHGTTLLNDQELRDVAASFQEAAFQDIVNKSLIAAEEVNCKCLLLGGGVCNNQRLQNLFETSALPVFWPTPELTLDNAAMIAGLAFERVQLDGPSQDLTPHPRIHAFWG